MLFYGLWCNEKMKIIYFFVSSLFIFFSSWIYSYRPTGRCQKLCSIPGQSLFPGGFSFRFSASCLTQLTRGAATSQHNTNLVMSHCLNNTIRKLKSSLVMIFIVTAYEALKNFRKLMTRRGWGGRRGGGVYLKKNPNKIKPRATKNL